MNNQEITAQKWVNNGFILNRYVEGKQCYAKVVDSDNFEIATVFLNGDTNYVKAVSGQLNEVEHIPFIQS